MSYKVIHPCRISGRNYEQGDTLQEEVMQPFEAARLEHYGMIRKSDNSAAVVIYDGLPALNGSQIQTLIKIVSSKQAEAIKIIEDIREDSDLLAVTSKADPRDKIKDACKL